MQKNNISDYFEKNGFVCLPGNIPTDLIKSIDSVVNNTDYNTFAKDGCKENILLESNEENNPNYAFNRIATHPHILDAVKQIIGPNILLFGITRFFKKGVEKDKIVPWHQDGYFYPIKPLKAITLTIAITKTNKQNGCLKVLVGSHKEKIFSHKDGNSYFKHNGKTIGNILPSINEDQIKDKEIVNIELEPYNSKDQFNNVISIHDSQLIHSSWPNLSGEPRQVFAIRYMPSTSEYRKKDHIALSRNHDGEYDHRELFLVSGKDLNSKINKSLPLLKLW